MAKQQSLVHFMIEAQQKCKIRKEKAEDGATVEWFKKSDCTFSRRTYRKKTTAAAFTVISKDGTPSWVMTQTIDFSQANHPALKNEIPDLLKKATMLLDNGQPLFGPSKLALGELEMIHTINGKDGLNMSGNLKVSKGGLVLYKINYSSERLQ